MGVLLPEAGVLYALHFNHQFYILQSKKSMATSNRVIVYGGRGGLGNVIVEHFKSKSWWVCSVDINPNDTADENVLVEPTPPWTGQEGFVCKRVAQHLQENKVDAIINMAGGWAGGSANSKDFIKNADLMWKQSVWSSTISAALAAKHLKVAGCLVLPGAQPALEGTAGMMGYGMAKAAVHQLTKSLGSPKSGLPENATTLALLPITLGNNTITTYIQVSKNEIIIIVQ